MSKPRFEFKGGEWNIPDDTSALQNGWTAEGEGLAREYTPEALSRSFNEGYRRLLPRDEDYIDRADEMMANIALAHPREYLKKRRMSRR